MTRTLGYSHVRDSDWASGCVRVAEGTDELELRRPSLPSGKWQRRPALWGGPSRLPSFPVLGCRRHGGGHLGEGQGCLL